MGIFTVFILIHPKVRQSVNFLWHCAHLCSSFDLVTNGGIAIALHFERAPFITQEHTLWLPWGRFFVMDTIVMRHEENDIPSCDLSSFTRPSPVVSPAPLTAFAGSCAERGNVVPEIQVMLCPCPAGSNAYGSSCKWFMLHSYRLFFKYKYNSDSVLWFLSLKCNWPVKFG